MGALQALAIAVSALLVLENGFREVEGASYSFTTHLQSSSSNRAPARAAAATQPHAVVASGTRNRADLSFTDYRRYLPVEDTPAVKKAREQFFSLYKKQASLVAEAPDNDLDGAYRTTDDDYHYYDYEGENSEYEEDDDDEEESEGSEEGDDEEDSDEESEDSDDEEDSSSSSEEDGLDSSEENGVDSSEEGVDSSEEGLDGEDSSSSSSSEEDDEDGRAAAGSPWGSRGGYQPLNTNTLVAPRPVTDTPEVKKAKRTFFDLYKAQAELSFNAPDDK